MREANASERGNPTSCNHSNKGKSQPSYLDRRETDNNDQAGHSRDATAMTTLFEALNRSL